MNIIRNLIVKFLGEDEYIKFEDCIRMYNNVSPNKLDSSNLVLDNIIQMIICFIQNNLDPNGEYKKVLD
ncbi:MAG: hypothetical protein MJ246_03255 [Clostridia bacterium]|nr:hypothetical protein [Clostridia bacterium]